ncbi:MAG: glycosyltransferase [Bacteroidota bacterium]
MKVLQLCHKMPFPLHDGGAYSIYHTALGLISQNVDLKVFAINTPRNWVEKSVIPTDFVKKTRFEYARVDTRFSPVKALLNLFSNESYFVERFYSKEFESYLIRILKEDSYDIVHLEHVYLCLYLDTIRKYSRARVVLRPQNVENKVWERYLAHAYNPFIKSYLRLATKRLKQFEIKQVAKVDGIIAISEADRQLFALYAPKIAMATVPIGFDFSIRQYLDTERQFENFPVFYHLGSMDWLPNAQAIRWFVEEVMPFVIKDYPEFIFRIAGKNMPQWFIKRQNKHLIVDRKVSESVDYHADKAIMIVPLLSGGGIRAKIIEGMALGKVIISTTIGAEGIPYTDQKNILIGNTKEELAIQISKCRESKEFCRMIGKNAQLLALEYYDCRNIAQQMIKFYSLQPSV